MRTCAGRAAGPPASAGGGSYAGASAASASVMSTQHSACPSMLQSPSTSSSAMLAGRQAMPRSKLAGGSRSAAHQYGCRCSRWRSRWCPSGGTGDQSKPAVIGPARGTGGGPLSRLADLPEHPRRWPEADRHGVLCLSRLHVGRLNGHSSQRRSTSIRRATAQAFTRSRSEEGLG